MSRTGTEQLGRTLHARDAPEGEDGLEQESCGAPRATSVHIAVGRSLGHGQLLLRPVERHGLFQSDLFLALDMLSSGAARCLSEVQLLLGRSWSPERLPRLPLQCQGQALAQGACCYNQHNLPHLKPQGRAHIPPLPTCVHDPVGLSGDHTWLHSPGGEPSCLALLGRHFGRTRVSVRGLEGATGLLEEEEEEGSSSPR